MLLAMEERWVLPDPVGQVDQAGLPMRAAELLSRRGLASDSGFLRPRLAELGDPWALSGMQAVVERLFRAVDAGERVTLYGDYDVDGVTSVSLLGAVLRAAGTVASIFLPDRMDEGYGLSPEGLARCVTGTRPNLLVAVDCGTSSKDEVEELQRRGIDVIILDHHEAPQAGLPAKGMILNPKASGEQPDLCSAGVVFKLAHAMIKERPALRERFDLREHLDVVAMGTVADLVPLLGDNRILVRHGLRALGQTRRPGLRALMKAARVADPVSASDVGFRLGPRLNAAGRLDSAMQAWELLECDDPEQAEMLADWLETQNRARREIEARVYQAALDQAEARGDDRILVLAGDDWHPGVVGIVAARMMRRFHRPAFVIGSDESGLGKGSGRSVEGVSLVEAIEAGRPHIEKGGGHAAAAGVSVLWENIDGFRQSVLAWAEEHVAVDLLRPTVRPEMELEPEEVDLALLETWEELGPFGMGFPEPLLLVRGVSPTEVPRVLKEKHYKFRVARAGRPLDAIWFGGAGDAPLPPPPWDIAFNLQANRWNGRVEPQMLVKALRRDPRAG